MYKLIIMVAVGIFFFSSSWAAEDWSDKPIVDEKYKVVDIEVKENCDLCDKKSKNPIKIIKCTEDVVAKYEKQGNIRGTNEYCKKHYGHLSFNKLRGVWKDLKKQRRKARINPRDRVPGEVTEIMFRIEEYWVESRLAEMRYK